MRQTFFRIIMTLLFYVSVIIVMSFLLRCFGIYINEPKSNYNLHEDGVCIIRHLLTKEMTNKIKEYINAETPIMIKEEITKSENIKSQIQEILGSSYVFHDCIFLIKKITNSYLSSGL